MKYYPPFGALMPETLLPKLDLPPIGKTITGLLDQWGCPILLLRLIKEQNATPFIAGVIDTGSYYNYISSDLAELLQVTDSGWEIAATNPSTGAQQNRLALLRVQFKSLEIEFTQAFGIMDKGFNYPVIIGSRFLNICDFRYFGRENRFELDL